MKLLHLSLATISLIGGSHHPMQAQEADDERNNRYTMGIWYDTEIQTDYHGDFNHVNLLYLSTDGRLWQGWECNAATISIARTREESLVADLQTFSNIEEENLPLALSLLCLKHSIGTRHTLHAGIRNVNEDYFTSPVTSLFINSSCGIFPTLSCNLPIANYPVASVGIHYAYTSPSYNILASIYNGQGYRRLCGRESVWHVAPHDDGIFALAQGDWKAGKGQCWAGAGLHTGNRADVTARSVMWCYTEQRLGKNLSMIADYSHAFGRRCECSDFAGIGLHYASGRTTLGLFSDYARFCHNAEWATEITFRYALSAVVALQASCHLIYNSTFLPVGLIRVSVRI